MLKKSSVIAIVIGLIAVASLATAFSLIDPGKEIETPAENVEPEEDIQSEPLKPQGRNLTIELSESLSMVTP